MITASTRAATMMMMMSGGGGSQKYHNGLSLLETNRLFSSCDFWSSARMRRTSWLSSSSSSSSGSGGGRPQQQRFLAARRMVSSSPPSSSSSSSSKKVVERTGSSSSSSSSPSSSSSTSSTSSTSSSYSEIWKRFLDHKEMPKRYTFQWYREMVLICTVFGITGSTTMMLVRPAVRDILGLQGTWIDGPWSYRICSIVVMTPIYATLLVVVGTIFGRHSYFKRFSANIFSRFGIPPEMIDTTYHQTKHTFRKW